MIYNVVKKIIYNVVDDLANYLKQHSVDNMALKHDKKIKKVVLHKIYVIDASDFFPLLFPYLQYNIGENNQLIQLRFL